MPPEVRLIGITGLPEVQPGADLSALIADAVSAQGLTLQDGDILVVTQKVVSKAEGRLVDLRTVEPSDFARRIAAEAAKDPRHVEVVLRESRRIVRMERGVIITETKHGFVCANAGVDFSNVPGEDTVALLPEDPDASAARLREAIHDHSGVDVPVIISDTFGRPWRLGYTEVAVGVAGLRPIRDYTGTVDSEGRDLRVTTIAVADELATAAELVMGKVERVPVVLVRGYPFERGEGSAREMIRPPELDLFR